MHAARNNILATVELLLKDKRVTNLIDHANHSDETALWLATKGQCYSTVILLLKAGANPHEKRWR